MNSLSSCPLWLVTIVICLSLCVKLQFFRSVQQDRELRTIEHSLRIGHTTSSHINVRLRYESPSLLHEYT